MNLKIKTRLIIAFVFLISLTSIIYYLGASNTAELNQQIGTIVKENNRKLLISSQLAEDMQYITKREKDLIITKDKEVLQEVIDEIDQRMVAMNKRLEELKSVEDEGGLEDVAILEEKWDTYLKVHKKIRYFAFTINTDSTNALAYKLSATTAKPLPCSPARAASTAAFKANRLVWREISPMMEIFSAILRIDSTV